MKKSPKIIAISLVIVIPLFVIQCKGTKTNETAVDSTLVDQSPDTSNKAIAIFYQMLLPSEMSQIFEKAGAVYSPHILNSLEKIPQYTSSSKAALNLGIYGVDFGYAKMFNQTQMSMKYFSGIHDLSKQLGIPDDYFVNGISYFQKKITNRDTITAIANKIYDSTHEYLKKNDRGESACLIILGGWVEALYISSLILQDDKSNREIITRIAGQKYSLNSLINFLNNYNKDISVSKYLLMLKVLKKPYDKVNIMFDHNSMEMDTVKKMIHSDTYKVDVSQETLDEITKVINSIRSEIIN